MLYLEVPYPDKDLAKQQGARWDALKKKWYLPNPEQADLTLFARWLPQATQTEIINAEQPDLLDDRSDNEQENLTLSGLLAQVQQKLHHAFPQALWVRAEIANLSERRGHIYLELCENDEQGQTLASCRAMIWASTAERLLSRFVEVTGSALQEGQKVLMQVSITFHEKFGFSLAVQDLDPNFTLGEIEANLKAIRNQLIKDGIYQQNRQLIMPSDLFRVAVISPPNAAGLGDFRAEADLLEKHQLCAFTYFHSAFQGDKVQEEMLTALGAFQAIHQTKPFDVLVIIRGGGAKLDLNPLNQFELAKAIALMPIPVLTGIGHERDNTILDEVACVRFDTPSKVINGIWHIISDSAKQAGQNWLMIERQSQRSLQRFQSELKQIKQGIDFGQQKVLSLWQNRLDPLFQRIQHASRQRITEERGHLNQLQQQITAESRYHIQRVNENIERAWQASQQNAERSLVFFRQQIKQTIAFILSSGPQSQLKRGFVIAKTTEGQPISTAHQAQQAKKFALTFQDGTLNVSVDESNDQTKSPIKPNQSITNPQKELNL